MAEAATASTPRDTRGATPEATATTGNTEADAAGCGTAPVATAAGAVITRPVVIDGAVTVPAATGMPLNTEIDATACAEPVATAT